MTDTRTDRTNRTTVNRTVTRGAHIFKQISDSPSTTFQPDAQLFILINSI